MGHIKVKATSHEAYKPKLRRINGLTIYFATKQSVFITDGKVSIVLERWFDGIDFYEQNWKPLMQVLVRKKGIYTVYDAWKLADYYDVARHQTFRFPDIAKDTIEIKESKHGD